MVLRLAAKGENHGFFLPKGVDVQKCRLLVLDSSWNWVSVRVCVCVRANTSLN